MGDDEERGRVIWITGLSGSGKTTLAKALMPFLPQPRLHLDGDDLRNALRGLAEGYASDTRKQLGYAYARLAKIAASQGQTVVCSTISMFHEIREWNRENLPGYFEIFLRATTETLRDRDYKRVYQGGNEIEKSEVVGKTLKAEYPMNPDLLFDQEECTIESMVTRIIENL